MTLLIKLQKDNYLGWFFFLTLETGGAVQILNVFPMSHNYSVFKEQNSRLLSAGIGGRVWDSQCVEYKDFFWMVLASQCPSPWPHLHMRGVGRPRDVGVLSGSLFYVELNTKVSWCLCF